MSLLGRKTGATGATKGRVLTFLAVGGLILVVSILARADNMHEPGVYKYSQINEQTGYSIGEPWRIIPNGDVAGGDQAVLSLGGIKGIRNIQCGEVTQNRGDLNCDIGAGSTSNPGNVVLNYDVGRCTAIYDGRKKLLAKFCPKGIVFYRKPIIRTRPSSR